MYLSVLAHPRQTDDRVLPKLQPFIDQQRRTRQPQIRQQTRQLSLNTHTHIKQMCGRRARNIPKQANTFSVRVFLSVLSCLTNSNYTRSINDRWPVSTSDECRRLNVCLHAPAVIHRSFVKNGRNH